MHIKKGDKIRVMRGKDQGKSSTVVSVLPVRNRVVVDGINMRFRHLKPRKANEKGQRVEFPASLAVANVMILCPECNKPTRVGYSDSEKGKKMRQCKKCQAVFK